MPAPIVLRNLSPAPVRAGNPPVDEPLIATRTDWRDGSRTAPSEPDPPVIGDNYLTFVGSGTPDPTFDPATAFTYEGAFFVPPITSGDVSDPALKYTITFKAPEAGGRNGSNGSLFIGGNYSVMGEVQIPALSSSTDYTQLNEAVVLQDWVNVNAKAPTADTNDPPSDKIGSAFFIGDTLYMSLYNGYDTSGNPSNVLICEDARNLETSTYRGFFSRDGEDTGALYAGPIPVEHQSAFGGATHFCGAFAGMSIISRSSFGPSFLAWSPESIVGDGGNIPTTTYAYYPTTANAVERFDVTNEPAVTHYEAELGVADLGTYLNSDPATRISDPSTLTAPNASLLALAGNHESRPGTAFIVPNTDTLVIVGNTPGLRYGLGYNDRTWESGSTEDFINGFSPYSETDWEHRVWTLNVNDIAAATTEPGLIQVSTFDNNRWLEGRARSDGPRGYLVGATFDPNTMKLYTLHKSFPANQFVDGYVVSVYSVTRNV